MRVRNSHRITLTFSVPIEARFLRAARSFTRAHTHPCSTVQFDAAGVFPRLRTRTRAGLSSRREEGEAAAAGLAFPAADRRIIRRRRGCAASHYHRYLICQCGMFASVKKGREETNYSYAPFEASWPAVVAFWGHKSGSEFVTRTLIF